MENIFMNLYPNQRIQIDFAERGKYNYLVIKVVSTHISTWSDVQKECYAMNHVFSEIFSILIENVMC